jgi:hypothetical protein
MNNLRGGDGARPLGPGVLVPGSWVRHPGCPEWGDGQVQSVVGVRVTVNFENAGKVLIDTRHVVLDALDP